jgi:hypothetical protein
LLGDSPLSQEQVDEAARAVMLGSGKSRPSKPPAMRGEPFLWLSVDDIAHLTAQLALMRACAAQGPLVIVGRAARWVLGNEPNLISINLHAPLESRAHRICTLHSLESEAVGEQLATYCDERRINFIKRIAGPLNPNHEDFDLCVDTWRMGIERTVEVILVAAEAVRCFNNPQRIDQEEMLSCVGPAKGSANHQG